MGLIDADVLFKAYENIGWYNNADRDEIAEKILLEQPTVNAVPVVRCKDCKHYIAGGCDECVLMSAKSIIAGINNKRWYSDFYCAWGERKDETD